MFKNQRGRSADRTELSAAFLLDAAHPPKVGGRRPRIEKRPRSGGGPSGGPTPGTFPPTGSHAGGRRYRHPGLHGPPGVSPAEAVVQHSTGVLEQRDWPSVRRFRTSLPTALRLSARWARSWPGSTTNGPRPADISSASWLGLTPGQFNIRVGHRAKNRRRQANQASRGRGQFLHIQRLPVWRRRVLRDHWSCGDVVRVLLDVLPEFCRVQPPFAHVGDELPYQRRLSPLLACIISRLQAVSDVIDPPHFLGEMEWEVFVCDRHMAAQHSLEEPPAALDPVGGEV